MVKVDLCHLGRRATVASTIRAWWANHYIGEGKLVACACGLALTHHNESCRMVRRDFSAGPARSLDLHNSRRKRTRRLIVRARVRSISP
jgi:hypothetical protein